MSKLNIEDMYEKVVNACLRCDPISACDRADDHPEPPWEVIDRILRERDEAIKKLTWRMIFNNPELLKE